MKTLSAVAISFVLAFAAHAQIAYVPPPACYSALTPAGVVMVPGLTTTNIPTTMAVPFGVGRTGLGFGANVAGTNAATTTNALFTIELSANGSEYFSNNRLVAAVPASGTGYAPFYTNWVLTTVALDNVILARVRSIQNTNVDAIFITNTCFNTR